MVKDFNIKEAQILIFKKVSEKLSSKLPNKINFTADFNEQTLEDVYELQRTGKVPWDLPTKLQPFMGAITNYEHSISAVAYYGNKSKGYSCIGFFLGSFNEQNKAIELDYIAKRNDANHDLNRTFFPSTLDLITTYAQFLNQNKFDIKTIALIGALEYIVPYYKRYGFTYDNQYNHESENVLTLKLLTK